MRPSLLAICSAAAVTIAMFSVHVSGQTQTTYTTETSNNTSACGSGAKESHCTGTGNTYGPGSGSNGFDNTSGTYIPEPGNVSHADIHPLITGFNSNSPGAPLVFVHYLPWFCTTGSPTCNGHVLTGYASNSTTTVTNQVNDIVSRGFDGIVVNWYGKPTGTPNSGCPNGPVHCIEDETTKKVASALAGTNLKLVLNYDQGSFGSCGSSDATCIENHIFTDFTYANTTYFANSSYLLSGSHPILQTFVAETQYFGSCTSSAPCTLATGVHCTSTTDCWQKIWTDAVTHSGDGSPDMIFRDNQGGIATFTHVESSGAYLWANPVQNDFNTYDSGWASFYSAADTHFTTQQVWGAGYKGLDHTNSAFQHDSTRIVLQKCGTTWLNTLAYPTGLSSAVPYFQLITWNDYDEGTALEAGIDNCWDVSETLPDGHTLNWSLSAAASDEPNATTNATTNTIDHYKVYQSTDGTVGENIIRLEDDIAVSDSTLDLDTLSVPAGTYKIYTQAVGKAGFLNKMVPKASGVTYTSSGTRIVTISTPTDDATGLTSPVTVTASAVSNTTISGLTIFLDRVNVGTASGSSISKAVTMSSGRHRLSVQATDTNGTFKKTIYVTVQ